MLDLMKDLIKEMRENNHQEEIDPQVQMVTRVLHSFQNIHNFKFNPNSPFSIGNVAYLANLSKKQSKDDIYQMCKKYGEVENVDLVMDPVSR